MKLPSQVDAPVDSHSGLTGSTILRIVQVNINGLPSKLNLLIDVASSGKWDIICVTETHLLPHIADSFVCIPNYVLFRHDTIGLTAKHGVCIYVSNHLMTDSLTKPLPNTLSLRLVAFNVYCLLVY